MRRAPSTASIPRSIHLPVSYDQPGSTRDAIGQAVDAGFGHIVLGLPSPYPIGVARWVADELISLSSAVSGTATAMDARTIVRPAKKW